MKIARQSLEDLAEYTLLKLTLLCLRYEIELQKQRVVNGRHAYGRYGKSPVTDSKLLSLRKLFRAALPMPNQSGFSSTCIVYEVSYH